ncbi:MAG: hypothetical protein SNH79_00500 [Rikenellaceae bacterium]
MRGLWVGLVVAVWGVVALVGCRNDNAVDTFSYPISAFYGEWQAVEFSPIVVGAEQLGELLNESYDQVSIADFTTTIYSGNKCDFRFEFNRVDAPQSGAYTIYNQSPVACYISDNQVVVMDRYLCYTIKSLVGDLATIELWASGAVSPITVKLRRI